MSANPQFAPSTASTTVTTDIEAALDSVVRGRELLEARQHGQPLGFLSQRGHHRVTLELLGTVSANSWIVGEAIEIACRLLPGPVSPDRNVIVARLVVADPGGLDWVDRLFTSEDFTLETDIAGVETDIGSIPAIAQGVRSMSGLSASDLAKIFPVARESYQRWASGLIEPSHPNLKRLLALQQLLEAVALRVDNVRTWLLAPSGESLSPYDLLCRGELSAVWNLIMRLPSRSPYQPYRDAEGEFGFRVRDSVHSDNAPTEEWEVDEPNE
jgi:transcriptional regulator with XRE-family HTH domain